MKANAGPPQKQFAPPRVDHPAPGEDDFGSLIEPLLPKAYQTALYLTRDPVEAEEVVQDAALRALRGFSSFTPGTNFQAWFLKILTNAFYQRGREAARSRETVSLDGSDGIPMALMDSGAALHAKADDPAQAFIQRLTDAQVRRAIAELPFKLRVVATMYFLHDLRYVDIARIVDCPLGTVRSRLHRARRDLKRALWLQVVDPEFAFAGAEQSELAACA